MRQRELTEKVIVRVSPTMRAELQDRADREDRSLAQYIRRQLTELVVQRDHAA